MPRFGYHKLVRDKVVDRQIASGAKPRYRQLSADEHKRELVAKIVEEAQELYESSSQEIASELADVQQALDDLRKVYGLTAETVAEAQWRKNDKMGAFEKGIYIDEVEIDENDPWIDHYHKHPDRYPEIKKDN